MRSPSAYRTILVGVDHSPLSATAVEAASVLASRLGAERVRLVHVVEPFASTWPLAPYDYAGASLAAIWDAALAAAKKELDGVEVAAEGVKVERAVRVGAPARELALDAVESNTSMIIVASHDRSGLARVVVGSVASTLLRVAHCPVLVVGKDRPGIKRFGKVLAAVDLSPASENVLRNAIEMAARHGASVDVISLFETPLLPSDLPSTARNELREDAEAQGARVRELIARVRDPRVPISLEVLTKASASSAILDVVHRLDADLVVVGASGHNAWHRFFLGSTATRVVTDAPCPVLVIPHDAALLPRDMRVGPQAADARLRP